MKIRFFHIFAIFATLSLPGCRTTRQISVSSAALDSVRVEVRTETVYVPDTVYIEIPAQVAERTTRDSASHLENDYAMSDARINTDGTLYHDLRTKPQEIPVEVEMSIERHDSIVYKYKDRTVTETVEVERKLSWWQQTQIYGFWAAVVAILAYFAVTNWKSIVSWIAKKFL